jgi:hypothetical protein
LDGDRKRLGQTAHQGRCDQGATERHEERTRRVLWVGSYESGSSDDATGTLTSTPFKVTQPWGSFLVGGGDAPETRVEVVTKDDNKTIFTARGAHRRTWREPWWILQKVVGREIFIRVVDEKKGAWGHVNFDDFHLPRGAAEIREHGVPD